MTILAEYYGGGKPLVSPDEPLLWLHGAGHERVTQADSYYYDRRGRGNAQLILQMTIAGAGMYERDGKRIGVGPGMAFMDAAPGDFAYGYPHDAREAYEFVWVTLSGHAVDSTFAYASHEFGKVLALGPKNNVIPLMLNFARLSMSRSFDRYARAIEIYRLLVTLISGLQRTRIKASTVVSQALEALSAPSTIRDLNISQLAEKVGCSREHLSREFKRVMKVSVSDYVINQRVQQAAMALVESDEKLESVAARCGFSNVSYFGYTFRKQMGFTPRQYRLQFERRALPHANSLIAPSKLIAEAD